MYTIKAIANGVSYPILNPRVKVLIVSDPYFEIGDNINGQAEFTVYPTHPYYSKVKKLTTDIVIYNDDKEEFSGRVLYDDEDFRGVKKVFVEGELAYFCDSVQRPKVYHDVTPQEYLQDLIDNHNAQVEERKQFLLGRVTVTDPNGSIYRYSNWETTRECLSDKLVDRLGGHLVIRHEDGVRYLDYLCDDDFYSRSTQTIRFGKNLLDFSKNVDASDIATCVIPLGAKIEEEDQDESLEAIADDQRLTIADINGGVDYVTDDNAVATYGKIYKTVIYDDVTVAANLRRKGLEYLASTQYENMVLEVKAIDLSLTKDDIDELSIGNQVHCVSEPHGLDTWLPLTKKKVYCTSFKRNTLTLGAEAASATYTSSNLQNSASLEESIEAIPGKREILKQALKDAQDLINEKVASGYAIHEPNEFIVADHVDYKRKASNLWRWGMGGLGHYSNGYDGPIDGVALTMDGKINGKMLLTGSVYAESIDVAYRKEVESTISDAETAAKGYSDEKVQTAMQTIESSISNLEDRINLQVASTKETVQRKNYVTGGEQETLNLESFVVTGTAATVEVAEYLNMQCLKLTFTETGSVTITQDVGTLPTDQYKVTVETAFPYSKGNALRPIFIQYGFNSTLDTAYYSYYSSEEFHSFKKTANISKGAVTATVSVYGTEGNVCYLKNIRCLRDVQGLLDDLKANLTVDIGQVQAAVNDVYENVQHDYCVNGDFSDANDNFASWVRSSLDYDIHTEFSEKSCVQITSTSDTWHCIRQDYTIGKGGPFKVRFKAACDAGNEAYARVRVTFSDTAQDTPDGKLTSGWQTFEFDFANIKSGAQALHLHNLSPHDNPVPVYITDVQVLGYMSSYSEAQLTVLQDAITAEVNRATAEGKTLSSSIKTNADAITTCVTVNNVGSYITQYYNNVIVAFNNNSKYIQLNPGNLSIYDSSKEDSKLRARFDENGNAFWRDGYMVGRIGTNIYGNAAVSTRVLDISLNYNAGAIVFGNQKEENGVHYEVFCYGKSPYKPYEGLWLHTDLYTQSRSIYFGSDQTQGLYKYSNTYLGIKLNAGFQVFAENEGATPISWLDESSLVLYKRSLFLNTGCNLTVTGADINFYGELDMHGYSILNSSDERLKENIAGPDTDALEIINSLDLRQFDWRESGEHVSLGLIAQQVMGVLPEAVYQNPKTGIYSLKIEKFIPYLIGAVQSLSAGKRKRNRKENPYVPGTYDEKELERIGRLAKPKEVQPKTEKVQKYSTILRRKGRSFVEEEIPD